MFLDWLNIKKDEFYKYIWNRRDSKIWEKDSKGEWILKDCISNHKFDDGVQECKLSLLSNNCEYKITEKSEDDSSNSKYTLMGRVYIDKLNYGSVDDRPKNCSYTKRNWTRPSILSDN